MESAIAEPTKPKTAEISATPASHGRTFGLIKEDTELDLQGDCSRNRNNDTARISIDERPSGIMGNPISPKPKKIAVWRPRGERYRISGDPDFDVSYLQLSTLAPTVPESDAIDDSFFSNLTRRRRLLTPVNKDWGFARYKRRRSPHPPYLHSAQTHTDVSGRGATNPHFGQHIG